MADRLRAVIDEGHYSDPVHVAASGLRRLADRIEALGGSLPVVSGPIPEDSRG